MRTFFYSIYEIFKYLLSFMFTLRVSEIMGENKSWREY